MTMIQPKTPTCIGCNLAPGGVVYKYCPAHGKLAEERMEAASAVAHDPGQTIPTAWPADTHTGEGSSVVTDEAPLTESQWTRLLEPISAAAWDATEPGGVKADGGKARFDLLTPSFLFGISRVLEFGARKYADRNWEKGISYGRVFGALMRHLWAWWGGEDKDPETGESHLYHAGCCLMFLAHFEAGDYEPFDDRS